MPQVNENNGHIEWVGLSSACSTTILSKSSPSDHCLFADLKKDDLGKRFGSDEEIIAATEAYFEAKDESSISVVLKS